MKTKLTMAAALVAASMMAGCGPQGSTFGGTKQSIGTVGGAVAGGLLGSQFGGGDGRLIMTGVGTLLGAFLGSEIGASLDRADEAAAAQAAQRAFETTPTGQTTTWRNPDSGNYGTIQPIGQVTTGANGQPCRQFTQTIYVQGQAETMNGTACRNPDGTWRVVA